MRTREALSAALLAALVIASPARNAAADFTRMIFLPDGDGMIEEIYDEDLNLKEQWFYDENGTLYAGVMYDSNPNPEDSSSGMKGDYDTAAQLAKQNSDIKGIVGMEYDWADTPIGRHQTGKGDGLGPVHNPNGDDSSGPSTPPDNLDPPDFDPGGGVAGEGGWFDPNGGSPGSQLKNHANRQGNEGDDGDGSSDPTNGDGFFGDLPAPPEIVNPNPVERTARFEPSLSPDRDLASLFEPGMGLDVTLAGLDPMDTSGVGGAEPGPSPAPPVGDAVGRRR